MLDRPTGYGEHLVLFDCEADMSKDFTKVRAKDLMLPITSLSFRETDPWQVASEHK